MKIGTLLKAGSLALDIFNHQSTQQLTGLVSNGIKRRGLLPQGALPRKTAALPETANQGQTRRPAMTAHRAPEGPPRQTQTGVQQEQWPNIPVRQALKYVTPDNMKKAMQWHGIIKSFFEKD